MKDLEKTINEAAREYVDKRYPASLDAPFIAEGFRKGAEWMLNNFKESIWHEGSEAPEKGKHIFVISFYEDQVQYDVIFSHYTEWKDNNYNITKWCYLSDILK